MTAQQSSKKEPMDVVTSGTNVYPIIPLSSRSILIWPNGPFKTELLVLPDRQY
jgi:hypothetical protein